MKKISLYAIVLSNIRDCQAKHRVRFSLALRKAYIPFVRFLVEIGVINGFFITNGRLHVFVRYYVTGAPFIETIQKPGLYNRRIYFNAQMRHPLYRPFKVIILSTTKGFMPYT